MRSLALCAISFILALTGCYTNQYSSDPLTKAKATAKDASEEDCCSTVTRAGMLKRTIDKSSELIPAPVQDATK